MNKIRRNFLKALPLVFLGFHFKDWLNTALAGTLQSRKGDSKMYDLTISIDADTVIFPGDPSLKKTLLKSFKTGDSYSYTKFEMGCHVGTHLDAPGHFIPDGKMVDAIDLENLVGPASVIDCSNHPTITADLLRTKWSKQHDRLLVKTNNSSLLRKKEYSSKHVFFEKSAIDYIISLEPKCLGIDYYNVDDSTKEDLPGHTALAKAHIPVIVCCDLGKVPAGNYDLCCLPLKVVGVEGVPVRAILRPQG